MLSKNYTMVNLLIRQLVEKFSNDENRVKNFKIFKQYIEKFENKTRESKLIVIN